MCLPRASKAVASVRGLKAGIFAAPWLLLLVSTGAEAHGGVTETRASPFMQWPMSVDIVSALLVAALLYARGVRRMRGKSLVAHRARHWSFYGGLVSIFVALQTPLDVISEHVFAVHQLQHLLLRGAAPMLLMLAVPAGPLVAGMPAAIRRALIAPALSSTAVRRTFRILAHPLVCTVLYVGTLYVWQLPAWHDGALLNAPLHYLMHLTMLASGLLFFWCVFDTRPAPWGAPFNQRLVMLGAAIFGNIPLGAVITLKSTVVYAAYNQLGRWWGVAPLKDELVGGLILWIAASMMGLIAVLLLMRLWGQSESRFDLRRQRGFAMPLRAEALTDGRDDRAARAARTRNGWALALIPLAVFAAVMVLAIWLASQSHPARPAGLVSMLPFTEHGSS